MTVAIILIVLKYLGMVVAGLSGILGLLVEFKDQEKRITRHGKIALALICVSSVVAIGSQTVELILKRQEQRSAEEQRSKDTLAAVQRTEKTLFEINRTLYLVKDVYASWWISVPSDHVAMRGYIDRFENQIGEVIRKLNQGQTVPGHLGGRMDAGRNYEKIGLSSESPLAPNMTDEKLAYTVLGYSNVELEFFKNPIDPSDHIRISGKIASSTDPAMNPPLPDLAISLYAGLGNETSEGPHNIGYEVRTKSFDLEAFMIYSDPKYWTQTGRIISIPELQGSQMFVMLPSTMNSGDPAIDQYLPEIRRRFELETLTLRVSGFEMWFRKEDFQKYFGTDDLPIYVYTFPQTSEGISQLAP